MHTHSFHEALKKAQDQYAIVGKDLAKEVGIGQQHLTNIRSGKAWPSEDVLMRILSAMEELAPGSRFYFFLLLMGDDVRKYGKQLKQVSYMEMHDEELADHLMLIGQAWKSNQLKRSQKNPTGHPSINVTNPLR